MSREIEETDSTEQKKEGCGCGCAFLLVCILLAAGLAGGGVYYYMKYESDLREKARHDSILEVRRLEAERHRQYAIAYEKYVEDSLAEERFSTPDLLTFGVHGRVKSIDQYIRSYRNTGYRVIFDEKGNVAHYFDAKGQEATIRRNDRGQIVMLELPFDDYFGNVATMYEYNINGTVACVGALIFGPSSEHYTEYNDWGAPTRSYITSDNLEKIPRRYIYELYDEHQNWTQRQMKDNRGTDYNAYYQRTIEYFPSRLHKPTL